MIEYILPIQQRSGRTEKYPTPGKCLIISQNIKLVILFILFEINIFCQKTNIRETIISNENIL
jgi:hypothetical protein